MPFPKPLLDAAAASRARLVAGYPWWLRPWLARDVIAITLGRRIYVARKLAEGAGEPLTRLIRHELVHVEQVNRLSLPVFLFRYGWEFVRNLSRSRSVRKAYDDISFEIEARAAERPEAQSGL